MSNQQIINQQVRLWLFSVAGIVVFLVLFGGFVRLTRSGLSIVEWNPVSGVLPPLSQAAWETEFAKYKLSPEYQKINAGMSLQGYQEIFLIEWFHRLVARIAGLAVTLPLLYFLWRKLINWRQSLAYWGVIGLFGFQGFMGWYMVSSGLVDHPSVSHYRLTAHLLLAIGLFGLSLWLGWSAAPGMQRREQAPPGQVGWLVFGLALLLLQIAYGGFTAGLKAGAMSAEWPLMLGRWIPAGLWNEMQSWLHNLTQNGITVYFIHRWLAFGVLLGLAGAWWALRAEPAARIQNGLRWVLGLTVLQITLGVLVVLWRVALPMALIHQGTALALFAALLYTLHGVFYTGSEKRAAQRPAAAVATKPVSVR